MVEFIIIARKWFNSGNTYHNVEIYDNDKNLISESGLTYGYGEAWKQTAYNILKKKGLVKEKDRFNHDLNRKRFFYSCSKVTRKRDL